MHLGWGCAASLPWVWEPGRQPLQAPPRAGLRAGRVGAGGRGRAAPGPWRLGGRGRGGKGGEGGGAPHALEKVAAAPAGPPGAAPGSSAQRFMQRRRAFMKKLLTVLSSRPSC